MVSRVRDVAFVDTMLGDSAFGDFFDVDFRQTNLRKTEPTSGFLSRLFFTCVRWHFGLGRLFVFFRLQPSCDSDA